ncbi:hypothetical protein ACRYI5_01280 [Furfurilactobacillus sp. WILCCON 0119]
MSGEIRKTAATFAVEVAGLEGLQQLESRFNQSIDGAKRLDDALTRLEHRASNSSSANLAVGLERAVRAADKLTNALGSTRITASLARVDGALAAIKRQTQGAIQAVDRQISGVNKLADAYARVAKNAATVSTRSQQSGSGQVSRAPQVQATVASVNTAGLTQMTWALSSINATAGNTESRLGAVSAGLQKVGAVGSQVIGQLAAAQSAIASAGTGAKKQAPSRFNYVGGSVATVLNTGRKPQPNQVIQSRPSQSRTPAGPSWADSAKSIIQQTADAHELMQTIRDSQSMGQIAGRGAIGSGTMVKSGRVVAADGLTRMFDTGAQLSEHSGVRGAAGNGIMKFSTKLAGASERFSGGALGKGMGLLKKGTPILNAALTGVDVLDTLSKTKAGSLARHKGVGKDIGSGVGATLGSIAGSALGPVGTAVGGMAGSWLGGKAGEWLGGKFGGSKPKPKKPQLTHGQKVANAQASAAAEFDEQQTTAAMQASFQGMTAKKAKGYYKTDKRAGKSTSKNVQLAKDNYEQALQDGDGAGIDKYQKQMQKGIEKEDRNSVKSAKSKKNSAYSKAYNKAMKNQKAANKDTVVPAGMDGYATVKGKHLSKKQMEANAKKEALKSKDYKNASKGVDKANKQYKNDTGKKYQNKKGGKGSNSKNDGKNGTSHRNSNSESKNNHSTSAKRKKVTSGSKAAKASDRQISKSGKGAYKARAKAAKSSGREAEKAHGKEAKAAKKIGQEIKKAGKDASKSKIKESARSLKAAQKAHASEKKSAKAAGREIKKAANDAYKGHGKSAEKAGKAAVKAQKKAATDTVKAMKKQGSNLKKALASQSKGQKSELKSMAKSQKSAFSGMNKNAQSTFKKMGKAITSGMKSANKAIKSSTKSMTKGMKSGLKPLDSAGKSAFTKLAKSVQSGMKKATTAAKSGGKKLTQSVKSSLKPLNNVGKSSFNKLASAAKSGASKAASALKKVGTAGKSAAKSVSPLQKALTKIKSKNVKVKVKATGANTVKTLQKSVSRMKGKSVSVRARATGSGNVKSLASAIRRLKSKSVSAKAKASGTGSVKSLSSALNRVHSKSVTAKANVSGKSEVASLTAAINKLHAKTVKVAAAVNGTGAVQALASAINAVHSKSVTITANVSGKGASKLATGTPGAAMAFAHYANGTPANGGHQGGMALVNDGHGADFREAFMMPDGTVGLFPKIRNFLTMLPRGAQVLDAISTKKKFGGNVMRYASGTKGAKTALAALTNKTDATPVKTSAKVTFSPVVKFGDIVINGNADAGTAKQLMGQLEPMINKVLEDTFRNLLAKNGEALA